MVLVCHPARFIFMKRRKAAATSVEMHFERVRVRRKRSDDLHGVGIGGQMGMDRSIRFAYPEAALPSITRRNARPSCAESATGRFPASTTGSPHRMLMPETPPARGKPR
jgi:hypothetical protein